VQEHLIAAHAVAPTLGLCKALKPATEPITLGPIPPVPPQRGDDVENGRTTRIVDNITAATQSVSACAQMSGLDPLGLLDIRQLGWPGGPPTVAQDLPGRGLLLPLRGPR
jgi:hypothetical protein